MPSSRRTAVVFRRPVFAAVAAVTGLLPAVGVAAEKSWYGIDFNGSWSSDNNWLLNDPPGTGDSAVFSGYLGHPVNTQDISVLVLSQLRFAETASVSQSWTINGTLFSANVLNETPRVQTIQDLRNALSTPNITVDNATPRTDAGAVYLNNLTLSNDPRDRNKVYTATLKPGANGIVVGELTGVGNVVVDGPGYVSLLKTTHNYDPARTDGSNFAGTIFVNNGTLVVAGGYTPNGSSYGPGPTDVRLAAGTNLNFDDSTAVYRTFSAPAGYASLNTRGTGTTYVQTKLDGSFVKAGTGTLQLERVADGTNFSVTQGTLAINTSPSGAFSLSTPVTLGVLNVAAGAVFNPANAQGVSATALTGAGTLNVAAGTGFSLRPGGSIALTTPVTGGGQLRVGGPGLVDVRNTNNYTGGTEVDAGTLVVSSAFGGLGSGGVVVNGGTLSGSGRVSGTVTVKSGGTVAPARADGTGQNTGTFTVGGLNLTAGGNVAIEFNGISQGTQVDLLAVNNGGAFGDADITGGTLSLSRGTNFFPASGKFPKVSVLKTGSAGTLTGVFARVNGVRVNDTYSFAVTYDAQNVYAQLADISDTNLDNGQDYQDVYALAPNYKTGATGVTWLGGDLSGDGVSNYTDLLLANSYVPRMTQTQFDALLPKNYALWYDYGTLNNFSVPEPASLTALTLAGLLLGRRRRRNSVPISEPFYRTLGIRS